MDDLGSIAASRERAESNPQPPPSPSRLLAHCNVLLPMAGFLWGFALMPVLMIAGAPLLAFFSDSVVPHLVLNAAAALGALAVPLWLWGRGRLLPARIDERRRGRYRVGHGLVGAANVIVATTLGLPLLLAAITGSDELAFYAWFGVFSFTVCVPLWIAGFICIYTSAVWRELLTH